MAFGTPSIKTAVVEREVEDLHGSLHKIRNKCYSQGAHYTCTCILESQFLAHLYDCKKELLHYPMLATGGGGSGISKISEFFH